MRTEIESLPKKLRAVCSDCPDRESVRAVVEISRRLAAAYLRVRRVRFDGPALARTPDDLALDLIAELFKRDDRGHFVEFRGYFDPVPANADDCLSALRRLVCSQVSHGLFDRNRALDPELARIIRNIKLAAARLDFEVEPRWGSRWIVFDSGRWERPLMPPEMIEARMTGTLREGTSLADVLTTIGTILRHAEAYRSALPVVMAAQIIRSAWIKLQQGGDGSVLPAEPDGFEVLVNHAVDVVRATLRSSYLQSGKLPLDLFECYLRVAKSWVAAEMMDAGPKLSLFERLEGEIPTLDRVEFTSDHRSRLEYISRLVREQLVIQARNDLVDSAGHAE